MSTAGRCLASLVLVGATGWAVGPSQASATSAAVTCGGLTPTIVGTRGDDRLEGTGRRDVIVGLGGNDRITAVGRGDRICGGDGLDRLFGASVGITYIWGGPGFDHLMIDDGRAVMRGGAGNDILRGGVGGDQLGGGRGNDRVVGREGDDVLRGGRMGDYFEGSRGQDRLVGGAGTDFMNGGAGDDLLFGEGATDILIGLGGSDVLNGGPGNYDLAQFDDLRRGVTLDLRTGTADSGPNHDVLSGIENVAGTEADDILRGDDHPNRFEPGAGDDTVELFGGDDWAVDGDGNDSVDGGTGDDECRGFDAVVNCEVTQRGWAGQARRTPRV